MKKSKYNFVIEKDGFMLLYNLASEKMALLDNANYVLYDTSDLMSLSESNATFFYFLKEKGFIVDNSVDESTRVIEKWRKKDNSKEFFGLTIIPTLGCNMNCWYCYEDHKSKGLMSTKVYDSIIKLVQEGVKEAKLKKITLSFFGGEPLLAYKKIVSPIIKQVASICRDFSKDLEISFVTNGFLLKKDILKEISEYGLPTTFQITLDGNRELHNKIRTTINCEDTYSVILSNIEEALNFKMPVILRFNTTLDNLNTFYDVIDDITKINESVLNYLSIDIHRVWQDKGINDSIYEELENRLRTFIKNKGLNVSKKMRIQNYRCYADSNNQFVINYDGLLFRCTARDFVAKNSEGKLNEDGTISFNEKFDIRNVVKYGNELCQKCIIFPLCHGGCSQAKLENVNTQKCLWNYTEEDKKIIVQEKITSILEDKLRDR